MTSPQRISIGPAGEHIPLARWGENDLGKPAALLLHGTGFVAEVWGEVATELASRYTVYALDRRGHGDSHKPASDRYHFQNFAEGSVPCDRGARPVEYFRHRTLGRRG